MKVKKNISQWSINYQFIFQKSRLLSQTPIFIIAVIAICNIVWTIDIWTRYPEIALDIVVKDLLFHFSLAALFLVRFILLFFKSKFSFWLSQTIWLIYIVILQLSIDSTVYCSKNMFPTSAGVSTILALYISGSFLRQIISLILSFFLKEKSLEINL